MKNKLFLILMFIFVINLFSQSNQIKLEPNDVTDGAYFGASVAINGNYALVGAIKDDGFVLDEGSAYFYEKINSEWVQIKKIRQGFNVFQYGYLGRSTTLSNNHAFIGAPGNRLVNYSTNYGGAVFIYNYSEGSWDYQSTVKPNDIIGESEFGREISANDNYLIVGAPARSENGNSLCGAAYLFKNTTDGWSQIDKILPDDISITSWLGSSVSIFDNYVLVGSPGDATNGNNSGAAYLYQINNDQLTFLTKIIPSDIEEGDLFGIGVSIVDNKIFVMNSNTNMNGQQLENSIYVYIKNGTELELEEKITSPIGSKFSSAFIIVGNKIFISGSDLVYVYEYNGLNWNQSKIIEPFDGELGKGFGYSLSVSEDDIIIGSIDNNKNGSAYISSIANLTTDLVADYKFNGNANDESGNGNNGIVNGATLTIDRFGNENGAYSFDGIDDFISTSVSKVAKGSFTINIWAKGFGSMTCSKTPEYESYFHHISDLKLLNFHMGLYRSDVSFNEDISSYDNLLTEFNMYTITGFQTGDNSYKVQAYMNGNFVGEKEIPFSVPAWSYLEIGRNVVEKNGLYRGVIDDIMIYDKALSEQEILALFEIDVNLTPVIIIPGIMGSPLYDDINKDNKLTATERIWIDKSKSLSFFDSFLDVLQLAENGNSPLDESYNIKVAPLLNDDGANLEYEMGPLMWPLSFYSPLVNYITDISDKYILNDNDDNFLEGENVFVFTYDWRKSNNWNGKKLSVYIDSVLSWTKELKVNIIAHSMGGLLTKSYVKNTTKDLIDKIIFIGTPHLGSPKIYYTMLTGDTELGWFSIKDVFLHNKTIKRISRNMPSTYQLFPSEQYFDVGVNNGGSFPGLYNHSLVKFYDQTTRDPFDYSDADRFFKDLKDGGENLYNHGLIDSSTSLHKNLEDVPFGTIKVYNIVGYGISTIGEVLIKDHFLKDDYDPNYNLDGDGTVPLKSAETINKLIDLTNTFYIENGKHNDLPSDEFVLGIIDSLLKGFQPRPRSLPENYSYANGDLSQIIVACPVIVHVYDDLGRHTGPTSDTTHVEEIPGSEYIPANLNDPESKKIFLLPREGSFRFEIISQDTSSSFDFTAYELMNGGLESIAYFDSIKIEPSTKAYCKLDSISLELQIEVDIDGDGEIDTTHPSHYAKVTSIGNDIKQKIPSNFKLNQNYPNPFNPSTTIKYSIPRQTNVTLKIYDVLGKEISVLVDEEKSIGVHQINFDASSLSSGIYFYKLQAGDFVETKKMILIK